jgi:sugar phosphate isomerase/epimerase
VKSAHRSMPLAATTFGFLYREELAVALGRIREAGYEQVELAAGPPHVDLSHGSPDSLRRVASCLEASGLQCVTVNPLELNPISWNDALAEASASQYRTAIELAAEVGATHVVMISGRASPLVPIPQQMAAQLLGQQLERLLPVADRLGVRLTVEAVPYGFLQTVGEVCRVLSSLGLDDVGVTLDSANLHFAGADPAEEAREYGFRTEVVHISDTWRQRWAHTQIGRGEVDFAALAQSLSDHGYSGISVYELADAEDPGPRLAADWPNLRAWGWYPRAQSS